MEEVVLAGSARKRLEKFFFAFIVAPERVRIFNVINFYSIYIVVVNLLSLILLSDR